jgi:DNA repair protein RadA/Sms
MSTNTEQGVVFEIKKNVEENLNNPDKVINKNEENPDMNIDNQNEVTLLVDLALTDQIQQQLGQVRIICLSSAHLHQLDRKELHERDVRLIGSVQSSLAMEELIKRVRDAKPRSITFSNFSGTEWQKPSHDKSGTRWESIMNRARHVDLADQKADLCTINMANVETKHIDWIWKPYISSGTLTCLDGYPGEGKSTLFARIAADISVGRALPGQERTQPGRSLFISNEDGIDTTLKPRLEKMGADCSKIEVYDGMLTLNAHGLTKLQRTLARLQPKIVFIDPLFSFLKGTSDTNSISAINETITPLRMIAKETNTSITFSRHLRKDESESPAIFKGMGSIGVIGGVRSGLMLRKDQRNNERGYLAHIKSNQSAIGKTLEVLINNDGCHFLGFSDLTAESLNKLFTSKAKNPRLNEAISFLESMLKNGPVAARKIQEEAKDVGISEDTLRRAKDSLGVIVEKNGTNGGQWEWFLMPDEVLSGFLKSATGAPQHAKDTNLAHHPILQNNTNALNSNIAENCVVESGCESLFRSSLTEGKEDGHDRQDQGTGQRSSSQHEGGSNAAS